MNDTRIFEVISSHVGRTVHGRKSLRAHDAQVVLDALLGAGIVDPAYKETVEFLQEEFPGTARGYEDQISIYLKL